MKMHTRCKPCRARRKLSRHPDEYQLQPRCTNCGERSWVVDQYRHRVELPQMRAKAGRYRSCHCDGYHFAHRIGFGACKYHLGGGLRLPVAEQSDGQAKQIEFDNIPF